MTPKTSHERVPGRGWAVVNAKRHAERRINPTRKELSLRDAIAKADLTAEYNVEVQAPEGYIINFLARTELKGKPCYIWFADSKAWTEGNPFNVEARRRKVEFVLGQDCYALELYDGGVDELWAQVEQWMMTLSRTPIRLAPKRRPGRPQGIVHSNARTGSRSK